MPIMQCFCHFIEVKIILNVSGVWSLLAFSCTFMMYLHEIIQCVYLSKKNWLLNKGLSG